ncbi:hypothetical protein RK21_00050 [Pseudomonas plecoglossicida]|nr:hypothetical protein RK21_00050 [Pseudomonas plecoglossicida]
MRHPGLPVPALSRLKPLPQGGAVPVGAALAAKGPVQAVQIHKHEKILSSSQI